MMRKVTRRRFLKLAVGSAATVGISGIGAAGYATCIEPHWLAVKHVSVPIPGLLIDQDGFTIAQLSDLHRGPWIAQKDIAQAVALTLAQTYDLAVLTGDYVSRSAEYAASCAEALAPLVSAGDVLACLGNHDHWTDADVVAGTLADAGINVLRNAAQEVEDGLWVAAVDDVWERHADLDQALRDVPTGATSILLAHEPDYADTVSADGRVSLQLSGHSHGGQVRLPFVGSPVLPYLARKYPKGRYQLSDMALYVNTGVGAITPPVRFNCRPEVTILTLRAQ